MSLRYTLFSKYFLMCGTVRRYRTVGNFLLRIIANIQFLQRPDSSPGHIRIRRAFKWTMAKNAIELKIYLFWQLVASYVDRYPTYAGSRLVNRKTSEIKNLSGRYRVLTVRCVPSSAGTGTGTSKFTFFLHNRNFSEKKVPGKSSLFPASHISIFHN